MASPVACCGAAFGIVFLGANAPLLRSSQLLAPIASYTVTASAFIGSLIGLTIILSIIRLKQSSVETIILSGIVINALFGAGIAVVQYLADNAQLASIVFLILVELGVW